MKKKNKTIKAWAVLNKDYKFPIPSIPRKIKGIRLEPSCVFMTKKMAKIVKKLASEKYPDDEYKITKVEIKIL